MIASRPAGTEGDLALPNNRMFLRMLVMERSLHFATFTIWDVVSLPAVYHMDNDLTLPFIYIF
jgi:hypothetical protein